MIEWYEETILSCSAHYKNMLLLWKTFKLKDDQIYYQLFVKWCFMQETFFHVSQEK